MISEIVFKGVNAFDGVHADDGIPILKKLSRINLFIGANNSGKSRVLRALFNDDRIGFNFGTTDMGNLYHSVEEYKAQLNDIFTAGEDNRKNIPAKFKDIESPIAEQIGDRRLVEELFSRIESLAGTDFNSIPLSGFADRKWMQRTFDGEISSLLKKFGNQRDNTPYFDGELIYIPMLRGIRFVGTGIIDPRMAQEEDSELDFYRQRTLKDYFDNKLNKNRRIFTGQRLYIDLTHFLLGDTEHREKVRAFETFLSETFFQNQEVNLIPKTKGDIVWVKIGNEERPIYELGDGIQSLIILLYPLFFNTDKQMLVFIEEPEHSLHPGLQRLFIETLHREEFNKHQFFITTHSNHFLDLTEESDKQVSVYTFEKHNSPDKSSFHIRNVSSKEMRSLELLGVRNSSVFLSNCTIWVEGVTDRFYISKFLEIYQQYQRQLGATQKYLEGVHYSFVEYSGSNLTHWSFKPDGEIDKIKSLSISNRIFLIADSDDTLENSDSEKAKRLIRLQAILGKNFYKHEGREVENTLSPEVLLKTIADKENRKVDDIRPRKFSFDLYKRTKLGDFIKKRFPEFGGKYRGEYGSINDKTGFCKRALKLIQTIDDLSPENIDLCKKLTQFISESNHLN